MIKMQRWFNIAIILKGIDGVLDIIGGIILIFAAPEKVKNFIFLITRQELIEDPKDAVAHFLINLGGYFTANIRIFGMLLLFMGGVIKLILVFALRKEKTWVFPLAIIVFAAFLGYQLYEYTLIHNPLFIYLSIVDILVIVFIFLEYWRIRHFQPH